MQVFQSLPMEGLKLLNSKKKNQNCMMEELFMVLIGSFEL